MSATRRPSTRRADAAPPPLPTSRLATLGLRRNPFQVRSDHAQDDVALRERIRAWLADAPAVLEFLGPRGSGKSTHLEVARSLGMAERSERWAWHYVRPGTSRLPRVPDCDVWAIDEIQRLSAGRFRALLQHARGGRLRLVVGTHASLADACAALGVKCRTVTLPPATPARQRALIEQRLAAHADGAPPPPLTAAGLQRLTDYSRGNLRTVEEVMYEVVQSAATAGRWPREFGPTEIEAGIAAQRWVVTAEA